MKKLLLLVLSLLLICGCSTKKEELVISTEAGFAPYEYYSNGEIVGVDKVANPDEDGTNIDNPTCNK